MKRLLAAILLLFASVCAFGQGATVLFPPLTGPNGTSIPFAKITFCTTPATFDSLGNCTNTVTVYQNITLTTPYSSAIQTDGLGNFPPNQVTTTALWFPPAQNYCYTATGANINQPVAICTPFSVSVATGSSPTFAGLTVTGAASVQSLNGLFHANIFATGGVGTAASPWTSASGTGGFQEMISALGSACSFGVNAHVRMPAGYYLLTNPVNLTANCSTLFGTSEDPAPIIIEGDGRSKTVLLMQTGGVAIDLSGRGSVIMRNLSMIQTGTNPSCIGILEGRVGTSVSAFPQNNLFDHVFIEMQTQPTCNSNNGSVGIYNYTSEGNHYYHDTVAGDHGVILTSNNIFSVTSPFQTLSSAKRFVTENTFEGGAYTAEGVSTGEAILIQGQANNTRILDVSTECAGGTPPTTAIRIKAPTAPDSATVPLANLNIQNVQAECPTGGQLIASDDLMTASHIYGTITNVSTTPIILFTAAGSQFLNPEINLAVGNAGVTEPLISDGGSASGGIGGGTIYLPPTTTIAFTNAASVCSGVNFISSYNSPSITCGNVLGNNSGIQVSPNLGQWLVTGGALTLAASGGVVLQSQGNTALTANSNNVTFTQTPIPFAANNLDLGTATAPWRKIFLGTAGTNNFIFTPAATTAARTVNLPDPSATTNLGMNYNATNGVYQSKRGVAGCTTGGAAGNSCASDITVTWGTAFADANYSVSCTGTAPTNAPSGIFVTTGTKLAATVHVNYFAITAAAASYATVDCIAVHD